MRLNWIEIKPELRLNFSKIFMKFYKFFFNFKYFLNFLKFLKFLLITDWDQKEYADLKSKLKKMIKDSVKKYNMDLKYLKL